LLKAFDYTYKRKWQKSLGANTGHPRVEGENIYLDDIQSNGNTYIKGYTYAGKALNYSVSDVRNSYVSRDGKDVYILRYQGSNKLDLEKYNHQGKRLWTKDVYKYDDNSIRSLLVYGFNYFGSDAKGTAYFQVTYYNKDEEGSKVYAVSSAGKLLWKQKLNSEVEQVGMIGSSLLITGDS